MSRVALLALAAALLSALFPVAGAAEEAAVSPPPTLTGEAFIDSAPATRVTCTQTQGTLTYSASGLATGPYTGTFTETGTAAVPANVTGPVVSFTASFTIDSAAGRVEGTKRQVLDVPTQGFCANLGPPEGPNLPFADALLFDPTIEYSATIQTTGGTFLDRGTAFLHVEGCEPVTQAPFACPTTLLFEVLRSSLPEPVQLGPARVTLTPAAATNTVGGRHTVTATVTNAAGQPVANVAVLFRVEGSVTTTGSCTTDAAGQCTFTYSGPLLPGADLITGCADSNGNGTADPDEPCGTATKAWVLPASTPGHATGGGQVLDPSGNGHVTFGFTAKSDGTSTHGECTVVDTTSDTKVKCLDATVVMQTGTRATFFGTATANGAETLYRIDVDDLGEPGDGIDTFTIVTASGYRAGGVLTHGNVQVHGA